MWPLRVESATSQLRVPNRYATEPVIMRGAPCPLKVLVDVKGLVAS